LPLTPSHSEGNHVESSQGIGINDEGFTRKLAVQKAFERAWNANKSCRLNLLEIITQEEEDQGSSRNAVLEAFDIISLEVPSLGKTPTKLMHARGSRPL
jgi:hypothetical protein